MDLDNKLAFDSEQEQTSVGQPQASILFRQVLCRRRLNVDDFLWAVNWSWCSRRPRANSHRWCLRLFHVMPRNPALLSGLFVRYIDMVREQICSDSAHFAIRTLQFDFCSAHCIHCWTLIRSLPRRRDPAINEVVSRWRQLIVLMYSQFSSTAILCSMCSGRKSWVHVWRGAQNAQSTLSWHDDARRHHANHTWIIHGRPS